MYVYHFHLTSLVFNVFASQINSAFQKWRLHNSILFLDWYYRLVMTLKRVSADVQEEIEIEIDP